MGVRLVLWIVAAFAFGVALAVAPAFAQSTDQRLKTLEAKTNFYTKSTKKITFSYRKPAGSCTSSNLVFMLDPAVSMAGTSYTWLKLTLKYQGVPGSDRMFNVSWSNLGGAPSSCLISSPLLTAQNGTLVLKGYCRFDFEPGDKLKIDISLSNDDGPVSACARVVTANLQAKLVNVGIHEPPD